MGAEAVGGRGERFLADLAEWLPRHPEVRAREATLRLVAEMLNELAPERPLDSIIRFNAGYVAINGIAETLTIVRDSHGPALGADGEGGEFLVLIPFIESIARDPHRGGINIHLETGESVWLGAF